MKCKILLAVFCSVCLCAVADGQKKLVIIGSSTSACIGPTSQDSCYVFRVQRSYNQVPPNDTIIDNGLSNPGYTVFKGMPTSYTTSPYDQPDPAKNITAAVASHPDVILVNYPTNGFDTYRVDSIMYAFRTIRDSANVAGIPCFITTTQPRTSGGTFGTSSTKLKMATLKDSILAEFGAFAIDFYTDLINPADSSIRYDAGDGIHMNNTGHDSLALRVIRANVFLATLPVTFLQFNAVSVNRENIVTWLTARESNIAYYEVQRSSDGTNFTKIGTVNANNNTTGNSAYRFADDQQFAGNVYYRVIIVNTDGKRDVSPAMRIAGNPAKLTLTKAFMHDAAQVAIELQNDQPRNATIELINNMGMVLSKINRTLTAGTTTLYLDSPGISAGVYHVRVSANGISTTKSFVKTF